MRAEGVGMLTGGRMTVAARGGAEALRLREGWVSGLGVPANGGRLRVTGRRLRIARLLRLLTVAGLRRPEAAGRTTLRRPPTPTLHQNFTEEPQPQLPVVFGLLNLKPEPWTPST